MLKRIKRTCLGLLTLDIMWLQQADPCLVDDPPLSCKLIKDVNWSKALLLIPNADVKCSNLNASLHNVRVRRRAAGPEQLHLGVGGGWWWCGDVLMCRHVGAPQQQRGGGGGGGHEGEVARDAAWCSHVVEEAGGLRQRRVLPLITGGRSWNKTSFICSEQTVLSQFYLGFGRKCSGFCS